MSEPDDWKHYDARKVKNHCSKNTDMGKSHQLGEEVALETVTCFEASS